MVSVAEKNTQLLTMTAAYEDDIRPISAAVGKL